MGTPENQGIAALSEKEKQTLRLIVRGHDAKSTARSLGLSVHTINERLRDARRKMTVSSSREAARLLLQAEGCGVDRSYPQYVGDNGIGEDAAGPAADQGATPTTGKHRSSRYPWTIIGVISMTLVLSLLALTFAPQTATPSLPAPAAPRVTPNSAVVDAARQWLGLLDQGRWDDSYAATGASFRSLNTAAVWAAASERVRAPLGAVISRTFVSQENLPAPPSGYEVVKFRTHFANADDALETVTLNREDGGWHVVGVTVG